MKFSSKMRSKTTQAQAVLRTRIRSRDLHDPLRVALLRSHPSACQVVCNKANYLSIKINASKIAFLCNKYYSIFYYFYSAT